MVVLVMIEYEPWDPTQRDYGVPKYWVAVKELKLSYHNGYI